MTNGFLQSFALVNCSDQGTGESTLVTGSNISKVETALSEDIRLSELARTSNVGG